jgi:hypothetical protein
VEKRRIPWWLWPNLLSLDAPLVAVAWMWMFARFWYVKYQDPAVYWILGGLVWVIYVIDRIRDTEKGKKNLRERHRFHWKHRKILITLVVLVTLASAVGFVLGVPIAMLWDWPRGIEFGSSDLGFSGYLMAFSQAVLTHGCVVLFFAVGFFLVGKKAESENDPRFPDSFLFKNSMAALTFSFGTAMGAHFYTFRGPLEMVFSYETLAFAFLCLMNLNAIDLWEREEERNEDFEMRDYLLTLPLLVLGFVSLLAASFWHEYREPFYYSMLLASAALLALDHFRARFTARILRVLADVALLLPLPIFWFWFRN